MRHFVAIAEGVVGETFRDHRRCIDVLAKGEDSKNFPYYSITPVS